jgi:ELWxxDGT repeat protein
VDLNGEAYFVRPNSGLWKATGASATLVQGEDSTSFTFFAADLSISAVADGFLYFMAASNHHGREIWRTSGTGVERVTDLVDGPGSPFVQAMYSDGSTLYFTTGSPGPVNGIWSINAPDTPALLLHNFGAAGQAPMGSHRPVTYGVDTYFWATPDGGKRELWRTDGTVAGTVLFFEPGATSFGLTHDLAAGSEAVHFFANDSGGVYRLWSSDGEETVSGPQVRLGAKFAGVFDGGVFYYDATMAAGPTTNLPTQIVSIGDDALVLPENVFLTSPSQPMDRALAKIGNTLIFAASSAEAGTELWKWELESVDPPPPPAVVRIDIKPDDPTNRLNLASNGMLSVVLFSSATFDTASVDISSVVFAGASVANWEYVDVDSDGRLDLAMRFRIQDTNLRAVYEQLLIADPSLSIHQTANVALTGTVIVDGIDEVFAGYEDMDLFLTGKKLRDLLEDLAAAGAI